MQVFISRYGRVRTWVADRTEETTQPGDPRPYCAVYSKAELLEYALKSEVFTTYDAAAAEARRYVLSLIDTHEKILQGLRRDLETLP